MSIVDQYKQLVDSLEQYKATLEPESQEWLIVRGAIRHAKRSMTVYTLTRHHTECTDYERLRYRNIKS
ncbi:hypothetical protein [Nostoc sp. CENA543]|uniref:hypothetical protein n=1 Tax=Nostoc sp. CENA543 TaxID=1869241 RepID=UPI0012FFF398|nr:hypothetical protein [Nostoc sp. CENA543]